jgi:hypothetical protein
MNQYTKESEQKIVEHLIIKTGNSLLGIKRDRKDESVTLTFGDTIITIEASFIQDKTKQDRAISIPERIDHVVSRFNVNLNQAGRFWFRGRTSTYTVGSQTMGGMSGGPIALTISKDIPSDLSGEFRFEKDDKFIKVSRGIPCDHEGIVWFVDAHTDLRPDLPSLFTELVTGSDIDAVAYLKTSVILWAKENNFIETDYRLID